MRRHPCPSTNSASSYQQLSPRRHRSLQARTSLDRSSASVFRICRPGLHHQPAGQLGARATCRKALTAPRRTRLCQAESVGCILATLTRCFGVWYGVTRGRPDGSQPVRQDPRLNVGKAFTKMLLML